MTTEITKKRKNNFLNEELLKSAEAAQKIMEEVKNLKALSGTGILNDCHSFQAASIILKLVAIEATGKRGAIVGHTDCPVHDIIYKVLGQICGEEQPVYGCLQLIYEGIGKKAFDEFLANTIVYKENVRVTIVVEWQARLFFMTREKISEGLSRPVVTMTRSNLIELYSGESKKFGNFAVLTKKKTHIHSQQLLAFENPISPTKKIKPALLASRPALISDIKKEISAIHEAVNKILEFIEIHSRNQTGVIAGSITTRSQIIVRDVLSNKDTDDEDVEKCRDMLRGYLGDYFYTCISDLRFYNHPVTCRPISADLVEVKTINAFAILIGLTIERKNYIDFPGAESFEWFASFQPAPDEEEEEEDKI